MKIVLTQPNYSWDGKRAWALPAYTLALLNGVLKPHFNTAIFDPNFEDLEEQQVVEYFKQEKPEVVCISSNSVEYISTAFKMTALVRSACPETIIVQGGVIPTVVLDMAVEDQNVDYWCVGEGEKKLVLLLEALRDGQRAVDSIPGVSYRKNGEIVISRSREFIEDLDEVPFPVYDKISLQDYGSRLIKYSPGVLPRQFPFAVTISSRGCPFLCVFCAASTVSGKKIRYRSANNVLAEIDQLHAQGIREVIFLDDHFLGSRKRAVEIMQGLIERRYGLTWKCVNVAVFSLDEELISLMKQSGCYQVTLSIESGNQHVLDKIIKKPVRLEKVPGVIELLKRFEMEIVVNFVIGFPGETWEQIRETVAFAESIEVDLVNFHVATPMPQTELMETCLELGIISKEDELKVATGFTKGVISTEEFSAGELQILRAFEWDRINFSTKGKREKIAKMAGLDLKELDRWRTVTRRRCGVNVVTKEL